jgi:ABC-2 type transport system permease protein
MRQTAAARSGASSWNWKTFCALLARDWHVARRNLAFSLVQYLGQPLLLTFVFGRVLTSTGMMREDYKSVLLPGTACVSMVMTGLWAVAVPLLAEFQFTREIEDRLLAPIAIGWVAVEKVVSGMIQALVAGLVVVPSAWLAMGSGVEISVRQPWQLAAVCLLIALFAAAGGLALGCSIGQMQVGLVVTLVVAPLISFGCAYYPWSSLRPFPGLQYAVLANPLVWANEGLRGALAPQIPHIPVAATIAVLGFVDVVLLSLGLKRFGGKAIG